MACSNKDKFQLTFVLLDHLFKLLATHKLATTCCVFKDEEVTLTFILLVKVFTYIFIIENTMATKVKANWLLSQNLLQTICCALALRYVNLNLRCIDTFTDLDKLFRKV